MSLSSSQLFYTDSSPYARIARMALRESGLLAQVQEVTTTLRVPSAEVLAHSPVGRVPTLVLGDGTTLTETALILGWLDRNGSKLSLFPQDARGLAALGRAIGFLDGLAVWNREMRRPEHERSQDILAVESARANRTADALERDVDAGAYRTLDAGYVTLASALGYTQRRHRVWNWQEGRPALVRWLDQASKRASFSDTVPPLGTI